MIFPSKKLIGQNNLQDIGPYFRKLKQWLEYDFVDEIIERLDIGFSGKELSIC